MGATNINVPLARQLAIESCVMLGDGYTMAQTVDDLARAGGDPAPVATAMTAAATMAYWHWLDPVDSRAALCPQVATPAVTPQASSCASSSPVLGSLRVCR